ncbi:universal stress protein [Modestobacter roseus]|uniref:universal stress protein n=1 Tax=Modestobacter roseus TaxID=1181884 RepID=UPI0034DF940E
MHPQSTAPVVAGVDGSVPAAEAARAAAAEAGRRGAPLHLVRAFSWPATQPAGLPAGVDARAAARRSAAADLERLRASLGGRLPGDQVRAELVDGTAADVLRAASASASLVVVGAVGLTWGATSLGTSLGTVAEEVVATSAAPVLVHRRTGGGLPCHGVVAGVDGEPGTVDVLAAAAREAIDRGEPLEVVHAWRQLTDDAVRSLRWRLDPDATDRSERAGVEAAVAELRTAHPELEVEAVVVPGRAGQVLVGRSQGASLVVIGRPTPIPDTLNATVHSVVHRAPTAVLVVPVPAVPREARSPLTAAGRSRQG